MRPSRRHAVLITALSVLALTGCTLPFQGRSGPATPEQAVLEHYSRGSHYPPVQSYTILGSRIAGNRAVVFVEVTRARRGQTSPTQTFEAHQAAKEPWGWATGSSATDNRPDVLAPSLVCGSVTMGNDSVGSFTMVTGRVRQPDVAGIEVDFSSGRTITDTTTDGMFAVMLPTSDPPGELRLLDSKGQVVHTVIPPVMQAQPPPPTPVRSGQQGGMTIVTSAMGSDTADIECSP